MGQINEHSDSDSSDSSDDFQASVRQLATAFSPMSKRHEESSSKKKKEVADLAGILQDEVPTVVQLRRFALAFIHSHSGATGVFRNAFMRKVAEATSCLPKTLQTT